MKMSKQLAIVLLGLMALGFTGVAAAEEADSTIEIMALSPVYDMTCIAVEVTADETRSVSGLMWYNNDDQTVFPQVMAAAANPGIPPNLGDALVIVDNIGGQEDAWSELQFPQPIASPTGMFYVIFQFPSGAETEGRGAGPGIGYQVAEAPSAVYLSGEGDDWLKMISAQKLLVEPVYAETSAAKSNGSVLMLPQPSMAEEAESTEEVVRVTQLLRPYPNPFNPAVHFEFTLKAASRVRLSIYDIRGRRVADLVNEELPRGRYEQTWRGRDNSDRQMASGVYFARMLADGESWTHRMVLVK